MFRAIVIAIVSLMVGLIGHAYSLDEKFGAPLIFFSVLSIFSIIALFFLKEQVFVVWKKFAVIYIPISIVIIAISPSQGDMFFPSMQEMLIFALPAIFLVASLAIIITKSLKLRGK